MCKHEIGEKKKRVKQNKKYEEKDKYNSYQFSCLTETECEESSRPLPDHGPGQGLNGGKA